MEVEVGGVKDAASPPKRGKRKLIKGTLATAGEKGKLVADSMAVMNMAEVPKAEKEDGKKVKGKGRVADAKSGKD
ncbi:hypothetical protein Dimus_013533, partial [Dionaea muscipula]